MPRISQISKLAEGRGTGELASYIPWIYVQELNSRGTAESFPDPKHKRAVQLLSCGELRAYLELRYDDTVYDIREQYPLLDLGRAYSIAKDAGIPYPHIGSEKVIMTTDLYVVYTDGRIKAHSCKPNQDNLTERDKQKLYIELCYWNDIGVEWKLIETDKISKTLAMNIRNAFEYYDEKDIHDKASEAKHLVAIKQVKPDMEKPINWVEMAKELGL